MLRNLLILSALVLIAMPLRAATPESGTINDTQSAIEFGGGPYVIPNLTNVLQLADQETVCVEGTPTCDIFRFEVNLTTANVDDDQIVVTVGWTDSIPSAPSGEVPEVPDYDLELYDDQTGKLVVQQASAANPEVIILPAGNRKYQLRIIPYATMNVAYTGTVQFVRFEAEKSKAQVFFGGAFGLGAITLLAGLGVLGRKRFLV